MNIKTGFNKNHKKWFLTDVLRAIKKYSLISAGENICVALSGGKDSVCLLYILSYLQQYSHLDFTISAIHIKTAEYDTTVLNDFCQFLDIEYWEKRLVYPAKTRNKNSCYICSRLKRGAISALIKEKGVQKVALGHHANDVAETLLMNIIQNNQLGSMSPRVEYADNQMIIIRPLIYLQEDKIRKIHAQIGLPLLDYQCPFEDKNLRNIYKNLISQMNTLLDRSDIAKRVVDSLENIDFTNIWSNLK